MGTADRLGGELLTQRGLRPNCLMLKGSKHTGMVPHPGNLCGFGLVDALSGRLGGKRSGCTAVFFVRLSDCMKRSLTLILLVWLVAACGTNEPVSQAPPLPVPAPADYSAVPSTTLYDILLEGEPIRGYLPEWTLLIEKEDRRIWEKHVEMVSVWYDITPDVQRACEQLLTSPTFLRGLPATPETHQTVLDVLVTQGVELPSSKWALEGSEYHPGGGPALFCVVASDGSEEWETYLPGLVAVLFGESDMLRKNSITGKLSVIEGGKTLSWAVAAG